MLFHIFFAFRYRRGYTSQICDGRVNRWIPPHSIQLKVKPAPLPVQPGGVAGPVPLASLSPMDKAHFRSSPWLPHNRERNILITSALP